MSIPKTLSIDMLYNLAKFQPNPEQRKAIEHIDGPLFLVAGPGSGKTRVLLWRTVNLIVFHGIQPGEIFLSTFTEKAARQLKDGLLHLLTLATNHTGIVYDISDMYVGTVHSLCQRFLTDRRFSRGKTRAPIVMDELDQYFYLYKTNFWNDCLKNAGLTTSAHGEITTFTSGRKYQSKHKAVTGCIGLFNRLSEEGITPETILNSNCDNILKSLATMYKFYLCRLQPNVDFSLLQQQGYELLVKNPQSVKTFKHIIIDEYQDTNSIQEKIFFHLATGSQNICVVGDDDQALYRFRGATVENFVQFPDRCQQKFSYLPNQVNLNTNYRSRAKIVNFYCDFIKKVDWSNGQKSYRSHKSITAFSKDTGPSVVTTARAESGEVCSEVASFVAELLETKKVADPNQIAFLYRSLGSVHVQRMIKALEKIGIKVYAPRAQKFLDNEEPKAVVGMFLSIFGCPDRNPTYDKGDNKEFHDWLENCKLTANSILVKDPNFTMYIREKRSEVETAVNDYKVLIDRVKSLNWSTSDGYATALHKERLVNTQGLSDKAKKDLRSARLDKTVSARKEHGNPISLQRVINRVTTLDWNILDLFYRFCGFDYFMPAFQQAESGGDEGPICNIALTSQYLSRFVEKYYGLISGANLVNIVFRNVLISTFLGSLYRRGESDYEQPELFPKGRIPFLTIHQAKGLEFPIVVLGNPDKGPTKPQAIEQIVRPFLSGDFEPLDRVAEFDKMRLYYVALSRAKNLVILADIKGRGTSQHLAFTELINKHPLRIKDIDINSIPEYQEQADEPGKFYSYTADYISYNDCPRRYMIFRKYGFAPSRSTTMFFGSLVHQTLEDLHRHLLSLREEGAM